MSLNNSEFPRQFTISSATSHFCSMCAETKLNPPHGFNELCLPLFDPLKREFFATCAEHDDFHRATSEREQVHLLFQWSQMQSITRISLQDIADFFGVNKGTIAWHLSKPFHPGQQCKPLRGGRPSVIPDDVLQQLTLYRYIQDAFDIHVPVTYEDLRDHLYYYYYYARLHYVLRTSCLPSLRPVIACSACVSASSCGLAPPLLRSLFLCGIFDHNIDFLCCPL